MAAPKVPTASDAVHGRRLKVLSGVGVLSAEKVNILAGVEGKVVFAFLVVTAAAAVYLVCDGHPEFWSPNNPAAILKLFVIVPALGLLAFAHAKDNNSFYGLLLLGICIYGPMVAFLLFFHGALAS